MSDRLVQRTPPTRKEAILASALDLFRRRGFHAVGVDEIGAAAGISGSGVYRHFPSKDAVLVALFDPMSRHMLEEAHRLSGKGAPPSETLERLVDLHVSFAVAERELLSLWMQDWRSLPDADRHRIRHWQAEYMNEWAATLAGVRPELSPQEIETIVYAAVGAINSVALHHSGLPHESLDAVLTRLARAVLAA